MYGGETKSEKVKVLIIESEAGWGQRVDETKEFDTREEAVKFCKDYNTEHNPTKDQTPDWYMYAHLPGTYGMLRWEEGEKRY